MKEKILIIEDDREFAMLTRDFLEGESYSVLVKESGAGFLEIVAEYMPEIILMDRTLPGNIDGLELVYQMRESGVDIPVIFTTSLIDEDEVIKGLEIGCCEYLKKPFGFKELKLRIERSMNLSWIDNFLFSKKYYIEEKCSIINGDKIIKLQKQEDIFLKLLIKNQEKVCKTQTIIMEIWGYNDLNHLNRIDVLVNQLREKLKGLPYIIENHKKVGYSLRSTNLIP